MVSRRTISRHAERESRRTYLPDSSDLERLSIRTVHELSSTRNENDPIQHGPCLRERSTFLDLPPELRIKIYPSILRYSKDQRIHLKLKPNSNGNIYVKEPTPPLCYAVPTLWDEILSIYYSENRFHIRLFTQAQRNAFKTWVRHRGSLLKDLRYLRLNARVSLSATDVRGDLVEVTNDLYAVLHLTTNDRGDLVNWWRFKSRKSELSYTSCGCWLLQAVEDELRLEHTSSTQINPVIDFALKICRIYDLDGPLCGQLVKLEAAGARTAPLCSHCGRPRQTTVKDPTAHVIIRKSNPVFQCRHVHADTTHSYVTW